MRYTRAFFGTDTHSHYGTFSSTNAWPNNLGTHTIAHTSTNL